MCKETPVIPVDKVADKKRIIGKMEDLGGGEAQGVATPSPVQKKVWRHFGRFFEDIGRIFQHM
jgi:hypothetical protein